MQTVTVKTNNHARDILDASELMLGERGNFDYLDWPAIDRGEDSAQFFRYRGELYDLSDFQVAPDDLRAQGWDGYIPDSFFSGIVVKWFTEDGDYSYDTIIVGMYCV